MANEKQCKNENKNKATSVKVVNQGENKKTDAAEKNNSAAKNKTSK